MSSLNQDKAKTRDKRLDNLRPQKAGEPSHNPKGRPKKEHTFSDTARELMSAESIDVEWTVEDGNGKKKTKRLHLKSTRNMHYGIAAALVMEALKGNHKAASELINRIEGKAKEHVTTDGTIEVTWTPLSTTPRTQSKDASTQAKPDSE